MPIDAGLFAQMGVRPKSFGEYTQELDAHAANKLNLQTGTLNYQNALQAAQDDASYRDTARGFGSDTAANYNALLKVSPKHAQAYQKSVLDAQKTQADINQSNASAQNSQASAQATFMKTYETKVALPLKILQSATTPEQVAQAAQQAVQSGIWKPEEAQQNIGDMPADPAQFAKWRENQLRRGMEIKQQIELRIKEQTEARQTANGMMIPDPANPGKFIPNQQLIGAKSQVARAGASSINNFGSPVAGVDENGKPVFFQPAKTGGAPAIVPGIRPPKDPNAGPKVSAEVQRQIGGVASFDKDLSALEEALKDFDPRSTDQLNTTKRARLQSLAKQAQLSAKEAAALGALSGPDMMLLEGILNDPTSTKGAISGSAGLAAQIAEARAGNARRIDSLKEQYGEKAPGTISVKGKGAPTAQPAAGAYSDAEKERRYQEWKAGQK